MTPQEFWIQCEGEAASSIGPALSHLSTQVSKIRDMATQLCRFPVVLSNAKVVDPVGLQDFAVDLEKYRVRITEAKNGVLKASTPSNIPATTVPGERDLRQMLEQLDDRCCRSLDSATRQLRDEANRCLQETKSTKASVDREKVRLTKEAQAFMSRVKLVSDEILTHAASEIKRTEKQFEEERLRPIETPEVSTEKSGLVMTAAGAVGILIGFVLYGTSIPLGIGIAGFGIALAVFGFSKIRKSPKGVITPPSPGEDVVNLRAKLKQISDSAERSVASQVDGIKSELRRTKAALDDIPSKEKEQLNQCRESIRSILTKLMAADIDNAIKTIEVAKDICLKWEKLAQQKLDGVNSDWKRSVIQRADKLSSSVDLESGDGEIDARIVLGAAQFSAPRKVEDLVGKVSISAPYMIDFSQSVFCIQAAVPATHSSSTALCTQLVLKLVNASRGHLRLRIWDPRMLGAEYSDLLTLTQFSKDFVSSGRALTTTKELDEALAELQRKTADRTAQLAKVQASMWDEKSIEGSTKASFFEILLVVGFPDGFSEATIRTLQSVATAGPRCGIFLLIESLPTSEVETVREKLAVDVKKFKGGLQLVDIQSEGVVCVGNQSVKVSVSDPALLDRTKAVLQDIGGRTELTSKESLKKQDMGDITFETYRNLIAPNAGWRESSKNGLVVQLGTGFHDIESQTMRFDNTTPHALLLGGTGSGKSNLLHSVVQGLAIDYSPVELSFYLADLKDGVEFAHYTHEGRLPHASAIAATADPRYAVALVRAAAEELTRRNKLFVAAECTSFEKYRAIEYCTLPRILLVIDEFQVLFEDRESAIAVKAALINICKKGRSAGIHLLLASQSLKGRAGDIDEVLGLIQNRILMKISEADGRRAVQNAEVAARAAAKCTRRGLCCIDSDFGSGDERYFRNPHVDNNNYFFELIRRFKSADGSTLYSDEEPVIWKDEPRRLESNPKYKRLEMGSRKILLGEPYSMDHAVGFGFSKDRVDCIALAAGSAAQQVSFSLSIFRSAVRSCCRSISATFILNSDAVLDELAIESIAKSADHAVKIVPGSQCSQALAEVRAELTRSSGSSSPEMKLVFIMGSADLSSPKRSFTSPAQADKPLTLSDIELVSNLLSSDFQGRLQLIIVCRNPATFVDQLALLKDKISVRVFGPSSAGGRLRDFAGLSDLEEIKSHDMGLICRNDSYVSIFKPFSTDLEAV